MVVDYDVDFPDEGYNDMTDMRKLNDCELARSLRIKFFRCPQTNTTVTVTWPTWGEPAGYGDGPGGGEGRVRVLWWASQRGVEGNGVVTKGTVGAVELSDSF